MSISASMNTPTSQFDEATATSYLGKTNRGTYVFSGEAKMEWAIGEVPNVSYVMSIITDSVLKVFEDKHQKDTVALNCFFFNKTLAGNLIIEIEELKMSRKGYCIARAVLKQTKGLDRLSNLSSYDPSEWTDKVQTMFTMGNMDSEEGITCYHKRPVFSDLDKLEPFTYTFMSEFIDSKFETGSLPVNMDDSGTPEYTQLMNFKDQRPTDFKSIPYWCDMILPPPFLLGQDVLGGPVWCPTMQIEVQFKKKPTGKQIVAHFITNHVINGRFDIDGQIWETNGDILATTRHQCLIVPWSRNTTNVERSRSKI
ncbi:hypothetical protein MFLAVUS_003449 [Mucor flavus]|uniref:Acyl-CoA thioesterase-like C-terminal domain-containing protein n=1 Tax=Mucor flavus TaxID=439312 RepID=A0ABP9YT38_9FUNG